MRKHNFLIALMPLALISCDDITISKSAEEALSMCQTAALKVIDGSGVVDFPSSFQEPFRDPTVVRLRYMVRNSEVSGTIRCYYGEDTDNRIFTRITLDGEDIDTGRLESLTQTAKIALKNEK